MPRLERRLLVAWAATLLVLLVGAVALVRLRQQAEARQLELSQAAIAAGSLLAFALALSVQLALARAVNERRGDEVRLRLQATLLEEHGSAIASVNRALAERLVELSAAHQQTRGLLAERDVAALALARSNRELDQFVYVASHDLKAPLRGVAHLATWVEEELGAGSNPKVLEHFRLMHGRIDRMEALINGILEYSRVGRAKAAVEAVDVAGVLQEVVTLTGIDPSCVTFTLAPEARRLRAQREPLKQVLMNLLSNAAKHGRSGTGNLRLELQCCRQGERLCFTVRDHGAGIDSRYHERIFGVFQTLAARDRVEGAGIGLALVKKLVEHQGGKVWLLSAPGEGSAFSFTWPLA